MKDFGDKLMCTFIHIEHVKNVVWFKKNILYSTVTVFHLYRSFLIFCTVIVPLSYHDVRC